MNIEEIHKIELNMLKQFKLFCSENKLTFFVDSGTLLGAVRHGGFIPWDDDVDLTMPRKDYEKLKKLSHKIEDSNYNALFLENCNNYYYPYIKLSAKDTKVVEDNKQTIKELGVFIDIFPIDVLPESITKRNLYFKKISLLKKLFLVSIQKKSLSNNLLKKVVVQVINKIPSRFISSIFDCEASRYSSEKSIFCTEALGSTSNRCLKYSLFEKKIFLPFEGESFPAPIGYIEYLEKLYGDYMRLPPKDQRIDHVLNVKYKEEK